jgi:beta-glucosidase
MQYVVEPGKIEIFIGSSSEDIRLSGHFEITGGVTHITKKIFFSRCKVE